MTTNAPTTNDRFQRSPLFRGRRFLAASVAAAICVLPLIALAAQDPPPADTPAPLSDPPTIVIEDRPQVEVDERSVIEELIELKRRQGGSAVGDRFQPFFPTQTAPSEQGPQPWFAFGRDAARHAAWHADANEQAPPHRSPQDTQTQLLRESAWQLDNTAQRLEMHELYSQADAVREVAQRLRMEARKMRSQPVPQPTPARR